MPQNILVVVTRADRTLTGKPTGAWLEEVAVPYNTFPRVVLGVTLVSPMGGETPVDPNSFGELRKRPDWNEAVQALRLLKALSDDFEAIFLPGGHGALINLPTDARLASLLADFDEQGKVVAAVCHGPAVFVGARRTDRRLKHRFLMLSPRRRQRNGCKGRYCA